LKDPAKLSKIKKGASDYLKYTGLAFQMAGIILVSIFLGQKIDTYLALDKPYATALISVLSLAGFMYKLYIDLMKKPNE
jgi:hypothetical protein